MIERIFWTDHALLRLRDRGLSMLEVEDVVREGHASRQVNRGDADWRVYGTGLDGSRFVVLYDHPALGESAFARVVSAWRLRKTNQA